jgi:hypothetical protein
MPDADPRAYELAYEEARRTLEDQERAVNDLRSRAGTLIAAAAITTSFFGGEALRHDTNAAAWIAIGCFVLLGLAVLLILWPTELQFAISPQQFIETYTEPPSADPLPLHRIQRDLALHMGTSAQENRRQLRELSLAFRVSAVLLLAEVVAWVVALIAAS